MHDSWQVKDAFHFHLFALMRKWGKTSAADCHRQNSLLAIFTTVLRRKSQSARSVCKIL